MLKNWHVLFKYVDGP